MLWGVGAAIAASDSDGVKVPAGETAGAVAVVSSAAPAQLDGLAFSSGRQINDGGDISSGVSAPREPACQSIAINIGDGAIVAASQECAAGIENVSKGICPNLDLEHTTVIGCVSQVRFEVVIISEGKLHQTAWQRDRRRQQLAEART